MTDKEYYGLIQPYEDAMKLLLTRLEVLNHSIYETKTLFSSVRATILRTPSPTVTAAIMSFSA